LGDPLLGKVGEDSEQKADVARDLPKSKLRDLKSYDDRFNKFVINFA
jgi:hypothetical protein